MLSDLLRVVVVEDYDAMRWLLVDDLTANGFQVDGCADAAGLWRHLTHFPCDLVLLDIGLPDEDGFSISRRLRACPGVAVVMLTGYASNEHQRLGVRDGADAYLVKPVESDVLIATLNGIAHRLSRAPGRASADWQLWEQAWVLRTPAQQNIPLNAYERGLLRRLAAARGAVVERADLLDALLPLCQTFDGALLERVIQRLHHKIATLSGARLPLWPGSAAGGYGMELSIHGEHPR